MAGAGARVETGGRLVAVVGPSGAGKDTLISRAMACFAGRSDVHLVQRVITRAPDAGGEEHQSVSDDAFEALQRQGAFAVDWEAHGLRYGIPASVHEKLALGHVVIANGSRSTLKRFAAVFPSLLVINVVARPEVLATRLEARGRESREDILRRLDRGSIAVEGDFEVVTIDNSGDLEEASARMIETLGSLLAAQDPA